MKKVIKKTITAVGVLMIAVGFITCMCETYGIVSQLVTWGIGLGMVVVGAAIAFLASWEEEDVFG